MNFDKVIWDTVAKHIHDKSSFHSFALICQKTAFIAKIKISEKQQEFGYIPLKFWFNHDPYIALPPIAYQYAPIKIDIDFPPLSELTYQNQ